MKKFILKHKIKIALLILVLFAFFLRAYRIDVNPPAVYGDELSLSWNAWNILKTGTDEYGIKMPLQFRSFNDNKTPLPVYFLVPIFAVFGMNVLSLRIPAAIITSLTTLVMFYLIKTLFTTKELNRNKLKTINIDLLAFIGAVFMAICPWYLHVSRGYFESALSLPFFMLGITLFIKAIEKTKYMYWSLFSFIICLYTYFTARLVILIFIPVLILIFRQKIISNIRSYIPALLMFILLCLPLVKLTVFDNGSARFTHLFTERINSAKDEATLELYSAQGPTMIKSLLHNRYIVLARNILNDYLEHYSLNFWYLYGDSSIRYFLGKMGMFYLVDLPFFFLGLYLMIKNHIKISLLLIIWLLIVPIPTALSGRAFALRSLAMVPVPLIFVSFGILQLLNKIKNFGKFIYKITSIIIILAFTCSLSIYLYRYHFDYINYGATWWGWENKTAIDLAVKNYDKYNQIFLSNFYTGMDLAIAFYLQYDPLTYREIKAHPVTLADNRTFYKFGKIFIGSLDINKKRLEENIIPAKSLYIGRPEEVDGDMVIKAPDDGRIIFKIYDRP